MTPSVEPSTVSAPGLTVVPARLLDEGEVVILAIKPSGWFCLLVSLPVLTVSAVFLVVASVAGEELPGSLHPGAVAVAAVCIAAARLAAAWFQWLSRLYVLTSRRLIRVSGVIREEVFQCPLRPIASAVVSASRVERALRIASLAFESDYPPARKADWLHISHPYEVQQIVNEAIARAK